MFFCNMMGMGYSIIAGALTLTIMVLPTIIRNHSGSPPLFPQGYRKEPQASGYQVAHDPHHPAALLYERHRHLGYPGASAASWANPPR